MMRLLVVLALLLAIAEPAKTLHDRLRDRADRVPSAKADTQTAKPAAVRPSDDDHVLKPFTDMLHERFAKAETSKADVKPAAAAVSKSLGHAVFNRLQAPASELEVEASEEKRAHSAAHRFLQTMRAMDKLRVRIRSLAEFPSDESRPRCKPRTSTTC